MLKVLIDILIEESYRSVSSEVGVSEEVDMEPLVREEAENRLSALLNQGLAQFFGVPAKMGTPHFA